MSENIEFKFVEFYLAPVSDGSAANTVSCEHCGHNIRQVFVIEASNGTVMRVGSECVFHLTARTEAHTDATRINRRFNRAKSQWLKKTPAPLPDESREAYIMRRLAEMDNALAACKVWIAEYNQLFASHRMTWGWSESYHRKVIDRAEQCGFKVTLLDLIDRHQERIARKYKANIFDFSRPIWDARKI